MSNVQVLTEYLRYQNATALAELMKIIPETSDGFFIFLESKPILARNVKATLRCMQNPAIVAAKVNSATIFGFSAPYEFRPCLIHGNIL